jgi:hypothetical protein
MSQLSVSQIAATRRHSSSVFYPEQPVRRMIESRPFFSMKTLHPLRGDRCLQEERR